MPRSAWQSACCSPRPERDTLRAQQRQRQAMSLTHFLGLVRGSVLKDIGMVQLWPDIWPILVSLAAAGPWD